MVVLGVDPGLRIAGFGVLKKHTNSKPQLIDYGYLKQSARASLIERVGNFGAFIDLKIYEHAVTHLILETPFLGKNSQTFLKLGYLRGIMYERAWKNKIPLLEFSPSQVKLSVTGYGQASKEQVSRILMQLFPGIQAQEFYDVTDAVAIALCGFWLSGSRLQNLSL